MKKDQDEILLDIFDRTHWDKVSKQSKHPEKRWFLKHLSGYS